MIQIPQNIFNIFQSNAQTDEIRADTGGELFGFGELRVGGAGGVDRHGLYIAQVGNMAKELQVINEPCACFPSAVDAEAEHGAGSFGEIFFGFFVIGMIR